MQLTKTKSKKCNKDLRHAKCLRKVVSARRSFDTPIPALKSKKVLKQNLALKNEEPYKGLYYNIPLKNPHLFIKNLLSSNSKNIEEILKLDPQLGGRSIVDLVLNLPKSISKNYKDVDSTKKTIQNIFDQMNDNFRCLIQSKLFDRFNKSPKGKVKSESYQDAITRSFTNSMIEVQAEGIRELIGQKKKFKEVAIEKAFLDYKNTDTEEGYKVIDALRLISEFVPDKYKKKIPPLVVCIRNKDFELSPAARLDSLDKPWIGLNIRENRVIQAAEVFHEYVHLIEAHNPEIMMETNLFLKRRRVSNKMTTIQEVSEKYNKKYIKKTEKIKVFDGNFLDPYVGRTYGDIDTHLSPTEVLTIGVEALFLDPVGFFLKDQDHYELVLKFLHGKI